VAEVATAVDPRPARSRLLTMLRRLGRLHLLRHLREPRWALPVAAAMLAVALAIVVHAFGRVHIDLEVYRFGADALLAGRDPYGVLPPTAVGTVLPFIYPPFAALLLLPLALVPWDVAWPAVLGLSTLAVGVTLYATARRLAPSDGRRSALSLAALALPLSYAFEPVYTNAQFGQVNAVLMALVAVDCLALAPRWPRGLLVGLAAAIKLTPAAFVLFFLLRGDRRAALTAALSAAVATALAFAVEPGASLRFWLDNPASSVSGTPFYDNQTFAAVLARLRMSGLERMVIWLVLSAVVLALAVPVIRRASAPLALVTTAAVALLVSPTSWSHHWVWVAPAALVVVVTAWRTRSVGWAVAASGLVVVFGYAPHTHGLPGSGDRELTWTPLQQLWGATFVWFTVLLLVALYLHLRHLHGRRSPAPGSPAPAAVSGADVG